jgi:hypothetical protein
MRRDRHVDVHRINPNKIDETTGFEDDMGDQTGYGVGGRKVSIDHIDCCCKKKTVDTDEGELTYYFIKVDSTGFLFDPWGHYSEGTQAKQSRQSGKPMWNFHKVAKDCFNFYLQFLKTRNKAYLVNAEREVKTNA